MKGSRFPGEGGDRQRQMGSPEKGPELKMDREVFVAGPLGSYPSALVWGWSLFWVRGYRKGWVEQKVVSGVAVGCPSPQLGVGP